ncbi:C-type LECtin family member (clec-122) [Strigomonas culicis]|uniref:C-type LECtin family member (Clec-122) n=1 Tax=Strigomonas culicis TaxID=28005 RepID=S9TIZ1_9TRYP|nr:C-type LECtin family member (clec-122) [Strigomonas culicis]|eukprot:EPY16348.1 C-type LECtin family member (clec-122) [Strigomonas culicis]
MRFVDWKPFRSTSSVPWSDLRAENPIGTVPLASGGACATLVGGSGIFGALAVSLANGGEYGATLGSVMATSDSDKDRRLGCGGTGGATAVGTGAAGSATAAVTGAAGSVTAAVTGAAGSATAATSTGAGAGAVPLAVEDDGVGSVALAACDASASAVGSSAGGGEWTAARGAGGAGSVGSALARRTRMEADSAAASGAAGTSVPIAGWSSASRLVAALRLASSSSSDAGGVEIALASSVGVGSRLLLAALDTASTTTTSSALLACTSRPPSALTAPDTVSSLCGDAAGDLARSLALGVDTKSASDKDEEVLERGGDEMVALLSVSFPAAAAVPTSG